MLKNQLTIEVVGVSQALYKLQFHLEAYPLLVIGFWNPWKIIPTYLGIKNDDSN